MAVSIYELGLQVKSSPPPSCIITPEGERIKFAESTEIITPHLRHGNVATLMLLLLREGRLTPDSDIKQAVWETTDVPRSRYSELIARLKSLCDKQDPPVSLVSTRRVLGVSLLGLVTISPPQNSLIPIPGLTPQSESSPYHLFCYTNPQSPTYFKPQLHTLELALLYNLANGIEVNYKTAQQIAQRHPGLPSLLSLDQLRPAIHGLRQFLATIPKSGLTITLNRPKHYYCLEQIS